MLAAHVPSLWMQKHLPQILAVIGEIGLLYKINLMGAAKTLWTSVKLLTYNSKVIALTCSKFFLGQAIQ